MRMGAHVRAWMGRLATRQYRRVLLVSSAWCFISVLPLGLVGVIRWKGRQALRTATHALLADTSPQLVRVLHSSRGTLTFLRDTLERRPTLLPTNLQAMGE